MTVKGAIISFATSKHFFCLCKICNKQNYYKKKFCLETYDDENWSIVLSILRDRIV